MKNVVCFLNKVGEAASKPLMTRPLACFSLITFLFIVMRLHVTLQPLLLLSFLIGITLIILNWCDKINCFIAIFIFSATITGIFAASFGINEKEGVMDEFDGKYVYLSGHVVTVPKENTRNESFYVDTQEVYYSKGKFDKNFKVYVTYKGDYDFKYGDKISFYATLNRSFYEASDFGKFRIAKGAPLTAKNVKIVDVSKHGDGINIVADLRNYIIETGENFFEGEEAMLFKALVAGDQSSFSKELTNNLSASGLSHVASVSGLHVSILGMTVYNLLKKRSRISAVIISVIFVIMFTLITGALPSTVRSAIMFVSFLLSKLLVMENDSFTALCFSAMIIAVFNPYVIYDWGFILSFLSVLGIQMLSKPLMRSMSFMPNTLADSIAVTLSAQIMTTPALTTMFGSLALYSVGANIIVSAIFLIVLCLCIVFVFIAQIPVINTLFALITEFSLSLITITANFFADLPHSTALVSGFDMYEYAIYYAIVLLLVYRAHISEMERLKIENQY